MTDPKGIRRRRRAGVDDIPADLAEWFAGKWYESEEGPAPVLSADSLAAVRARGEHCLSRMERRALGLPVEPLKRTPWSALIYPDSVLLHERWAAWKAQHPHAVPPPGYERIAEAPPERIHGMSYQEAVAQARACLLRGRRYGKR